MSVLLPSTLMMTGKDKPEVASASSDYVAFLIRCWREGNSWRFMLKTIGKTRSQQQGFVGYEQLSAFLQQQFSEADGDPRSDQKE